MNNDGQPEYVVLVARFEDDDGWKSEAHAELEAYRLNGKSLSATDSRWPIRVVRSLDPYSRDVMGLNGSVAVLDMDGDGRLEFVQILAPEHIARPASRWASARVSSRS